MDMVKERAINWHPLVMRLSPTFELNADTFYDVAQANQDLRMELSARGDLIVMPPTGGNTGRRNFKLTAKFGQWAEGNTQGEAFDSSTGFRLPNGAVRSPDMSWVSSAKLETLTHEQMEKYPPLCPDFVLELRSPTDRLEFVKEKMQEYMENGAELGWLIDPMEEKVYLYTADGVEEQEHPQEIRGIGVLEGFVLELDEIW